MTGLLADADLFAAAPCVGHHELHDPRDEKEHLDLVEQRHHAALSNCRRCPCTTACARVRDTLPRLGGWCRTAYVDAVVSTATSVGGPGRA